MDRFLEQVTIEASQMYVNEGDRPFANTVGVWLYIFVDFGGSLWFDRQTSIIFPFRPSKNYQIKFFWTFSHT